MAACGGSKPAEQPAADAPATQTPTAEKGAEPFKIGIVQLVEHPALDASYKGFVDGLKDAGLVEGTDFVLDYQNAQGEQANCQTIATKLVNDKSDLILAIATPAAQAVAATTSDIPVLVTAVTDPADAKLVKSNEVPGGNISGTSDLTPVAEQIKLLKELAPKTQKIAMLYCSSESNSKFQVELAKAAAEKLGIECIDATVSNSNEIQQVVESLIGKVDAIYAPTDNMIAAGMATVNMVAEPAKIPVIVGEEGMCKSGGLATYGINYYNLGKLTAKQAVKILKDGAKPAEMPIEYLTDCDLIINKTIADKLGVTVSAELSNKATFVEMK
ncbi:MAG: ABC transporter substrate-binding protein [Oscillospiraceae bacterium]